MTGRMRHHDIDYVEIPVDDLDVAKAFYGAAFGWTFTDYGPDYAGIRSLDGPDAEIGGIARVEATAGPRGVRGPLVILYSDDLEATVRAVQDAGGVVSTPPYGFPGGRRFHLTDTAGNELAVWSREESA